MKLNNKILLLSASVLLLSMGACKKSYLDRMPTSEAPMSEIFKTTTSARAALQGLHRQMYEVPSGRQDDQFGQKSIDLYNDLMGDDMALTDRGAGWFVSIYNYTAPRRGSAPGSYPWMFYFKIVNNANQIISNIDDAVGPQEERDDIKGQAYFYRAYAYYNLSLYYQHTYAVAKELPGLPLYTEPTREGKPRATMEQTYDLILDDLANAEAFLTAANSVRTDKSQIGLEVLYGLHARIALSMQKWDDAADYANMARANYPYMSSAQMLNGFNDWNNSEWIWGSKLVDEQTSNVASFIGQMDINSGGYAALGQQKHLNRVLFNFIPNSDVRKQWWFALAEGRYKRFSQKKFKVKVPGTFGMDVPYMRSAEMALIEAEALTHRGRLPEAATVLEDFVKTRQPDYDVSLYSGNKKNMLQAIWIQRRIELWGEGFRYSDIKRTGAFQPLGYLETNADLFGSLKFEGLHREGTGAVAEIMGSNAVTIPDPFDNMFLFRIPGSEISVNSQIEQNP